MAASVSTRWHNERLFAIAMLLCISAYRIYCDYLERLCGCFCFKIRFTMSFEETDMYVIEVLVSSSLCATNCLEVHPTLAGRHQ